MGPDGLPSFVLHLFDGDMVSVGDAEELSETSNLHGSCECCCGLGDPGENFRFGSFICDDCSQVFEVLTQSSSSLFTIMSVLMPLVLLVISLVFSALICMLKSVGVLSRRSTKLASSSFLPGRPSMSLQEEIEERGGVHTALSYSDYCYESVPYAVIKVDCAGGLVIEVLYHSDQVGVDVVLPHG